MRKEIEINIYKNATKKNPHSYRMKVVYQDVHDNFEIKTTTPRFENKAEAEAAKEIWLLDYGKNRGHFIPPKVVTVKPLTFLEYADDYEIKKISDIKSKRTFYYEMRMLKEYFKTFLLSGIDYAEIVEFIKHVREPYLVDRKERAKERTINPKTGRLKYEETIIKVEKVRSDSSVNLLVKRLKNLLYTAAREKKINRPDFHKLVISEKNAKTYTIKFDELEKLLAACTDDRAHLYTQVLCIFESSVRNSEMKAIKKKHLDINSQFCKVKISKQKTAHQERPPRRCYFPKILIDAIKADGFDEKGDNDYLFDTRDNKRSWNTAKKLAFADTANKKRRKRLLGLKFQKSLRKSAALNYDAAGMDKDVKEYQLSHAPTTVEGKHYRKVKKKKQFKEFQKYEKFSANERAKLQKAMTVSSS